MKKKQLLYLLACNLLIAGTTQAESLDKQSTPVATIQNISVTNELNTDISSPTSSLIILIIAGLAGGFFAKKHHDLAKKHQDFVNRH